MANFCCPECHVNYWTHKPGCTLRPHSQFTDEFLARVSAVVGPARWREMITDPMLGFPTPEDAIIALLEHGKICDETLDQIRELAAR